MDITQIYLGSHKVGDLLSQRLQLNDDVIAHLLSADDWTMMILAWALVEACLNQAVAQRLSNDSLSSFVERLSIGGRTGKAELAYKLDLLDEQGRNFISTFCEVRNRFAHGVRRFRTTFEQYFSSVSDVSKYENALPFKEIPNQSNSATITFSNDKRIIILVNVIMVCIKLTISQNGSKV